MNERPSLAATIMTFNEQENIQACLDSVSSWVDEIIVLDSFSTDATEEICRRNPKVTFSQHGFDGFSQQANRAMEMCTTDWILAIDADERVTPQLRDSSSSDLPYASLYPPRGLVSQRPLPTLQERLGALGRTKSAPSPYHFR